MDEARKVSPSCPSGVVVFSGKVYAGAAARVFTAKENSSRRFLAGGFRALLLGRFSCGAKGERKGRGG